MGWLDEEGGHYRGGLPGEYTADRQRYIFEVGQCECLIHPEYTRASVFTVGGLIIDFDMALTDIRYPGFRDSEAGIQWQFCIPVLIEGRVRNLDYQDYVLWTGVSIGVEVVPPPDNRYIGFRFRDPVESNRDLCPDASPTSKLRS